MATILRDALMMSLVTGFPAFFVFGGDTTGADDGKGGESSALVPAPMWKMEGEGALAAAQVSPSESKNPIAYPGDCRARCISLCKRCSDHNKPPSVIGHFCSDDGKGWQACMGITENPARCEDPTFLKACDERSA